MLRISLKVPLHNHFFKCHRKTFDICFCRKYSVSVLTSIVENSKDHILCAVMTSNDLTQIIIPTKTFITEFYCHSISSCRTGLGVVKVSFQRVNVTFNHSIYQSVQEFKTCRHMNEHKFNQSSHYSC